MRELIGNQLIVIALMIWLAYLGSRFLRRLNLPTVTGFMFVGILLGPQMLNVLSERLLDQLGFFEPFALAVITFIIGEQLNVKSLKALGRKVVFVPLVEIGLTVGITYGLAILLTGSQGLAILLAFLAISTAPATFTAVRSEAKARGGKTSLVAASVAINNVACVALFSLALPFAFWLTTSEGSISEASFLSITGVLGSLGISALVVLLLDTLIDRVETSGEMLVLVLSHLALSVALSVIIGVSPLLTGLLIGLFTANFLAGPDLRKRIFESADAITEPIYLIFFVLAGASLRFDLVLATGVALLAYIGGRAVGKIVGPFLGALLSGYPFVEARHFSYAFLSQSAIAIGLSLFAKDSFPALGESLNTMILGAVVFFELAGPYFLTRFFDVTGEAGSKAEAGRLAPTDPPSVVMTPIGERMPSDTKLRIVGQQAKEGGGKIIAVNIQRRFKGSDQVRLGSEAEAVLKTFKNMADKAEIPVEVRVESSENVGEAICRVAREEDADLIVMGASQRGRLGVRFRGGLSDQVSRLAPCPVVVVAE